VPAGASTFDRCGVCEPDVVGDRLERSSGGSINVASVAAFFSRGTYSASPEWTVTAGAKGRWSTAERVIDANGSRWVLGLTIAVGLVTAGIPGALLAVPLLAVLNSGIRSLHSDVDEHTNPTEVDVSETRDADEPPTPHLHACGRPQHRHPIGTDRARSQFGIDRNEHFCRLAMTVL
jgi:hypothetical protein